jgi:hypothetical protein
MNTSPTIPKRYILAGQTVARRVPEVLGRRGLTPAFDRWVLTAHAGHVWLFGALDVREVERLERYTDDDLLHHLSTACDGVPVYPSNTNGLRYGFLLSRRPRLPRRADFPGCARGVARLGERGDGPLAVRWNDLGHLLVAGMTRSGKSNFLRLLVYQALREGTALLLADLDGATFPMLAGSPTLLASVARAPEDAHTLVARALAECDRRAALYQAVPGYPEKVEEYNEVVTTRGGQGRSGATPLLPRLLVILDEFNATCVALGSARGQFAGDVAALCWRGLKFGVNVIVAAQDFDKRIVGRMRDQVNAICFRVRSPELARAVGCAGPHRIPEGLPGRAVTDRWGPLQTYYLDKTLLVGGDPAPVLDEREQALVGWALAENGGYLGLAEMMARGWGQGEARRLARDWEMRGWLAKDPDAANKRRITGALEALAYNLQTLHSPTDPVESLQTAPQTAGRADG